MNGIDNDIAQCLLTLTDGGLILYPTDTVWGIGCDATVPLAVSAIYKLKKREESKSMLVLLSSISDLHTYVKHVPENIHQLIDSFNSPTTVIYNDAMNLAPNLINTDGTIGIRIVQDPFCKLLINKFGRPIVSTSANVTGVPTPQMFKEITQEIKDGVAYIAQHRQNEITPVQPSRVIKLHANGEYEILR